MAKSTWSLPRPGAQRLARAAALLAVATILSRVLGLVREIVTAALFGASNAKAAYVVAYYVPFFIQRLLLGGTLSIVFIPTIAEYLGRGDRREIARVGAILFNLVLVLGVAMVLLGELIAPLIVPLAAPGFQAQPGLVTLAVELTRIIFAAMFFLALAIFATGYLQAHQRFTVPALAPLLFNLVIIGGTLWLGSRVGIVGLAMAWVLGTAVQFLVQVPAMVASGFRYLPILDLRHPAVRKLLALAGPAMLGLAIIEINAYVARFFASFLPPLPDVNAVAVLDYAYEVMQAPVGIIAISIATAIFPTLSRQAAEGDRRGLRGTTAFGLRLILVLILPVTALLLALAHPTVRLLFERGEFTPGATAAVASALRGYTVGLTGVGAYYVITRAFYALHDMRTPVKVGGAMIVLNAVLDYALMRVLGATGIALASSIVNVTNVVLLLWLLRRRIGAFEGRRALSTLARAGASALLAGGSAAILFGFLAERLSEGPMEEVLALGAAGGTGLLIYLVGARIFKVEELGSIWTMLATRRTAPLREGSG